MDIYHLEPDEGALAANRWRQYSDYIFLVEGDESYGLEHIYYRHVYEDQDFPTYLGITDTSDLGNFLLERVGNYKATYGPFLGTNEDFYLFIYAIKTASHGVVYMHVLLDVKEHKIITAFVSEKPKITNLNQRLGNRDVDAILEDEGF